MLFIFNNFYLLIYFSEPPKSFTIIKENLPIELGTEITVVDGKLETVHCESRKSNPAPLLEWFLGKIFLNIMKTKLSFLKKIVYYYLYTLLHYILLRKSRVHST